MKASVSSLLKTRLLPLLLIAATAPAHAQPSGLLLNAERFGLREADTNLQLRFSTETPPTASASNIEGGAVPRNTLRADWSVFGYGLRTSLGLSWNTPESASQLSSSTLAPSSFVGFGWRGEPFRNSAWKLSAEMGTKLSGSSACSSGNCPSLRPQGMSGDAGGNGLRLNPYVSFGASYSY